MKSAAAWLMKAVKVDWLRDWIVRRGSAYRHQDYPVLRCRCAIGYWLELGKRLASTKTTT
jgi:hypothetical protein